MKDYIKTLKGKLGRRLRDKILNMALEKQLR
jgi:hypothetical protein